MKIKDIIEAADRDPSKSYSKLDQEFRNRTKPRIASIEKPTDFQTPGRARLSGTPPKQSSSRAGAGKNITTERADTEAWDLPGDVTKFFDEFDREAKAAITQLGVTPYYRRMNRGKKPDGSIMWGYSVAVKTNNNVPVDINPSNNTLWMGGLNKPGQKEALLSAMKDNGFEIATSLRRDGTIGFVKSGLDKYKALADAIDIVESMGPDFKSPARSGARSQMDTSSEPQDYYYKLARGLVDSYTSGQAWALSRGGSESSVGGFDANDPVIIVGYTEAGYKIKQGNQKLGSLYREHAVPCDLINAMGIKICKDMEVPVVKNGRFSAEGNRIVRKATHVVMNMIQRNLMIVMCSTYEGKTILDQYNGWQTTMPEGWKNGDNPLDRFIKAKLPDEYVKANKLKSNTGIPVYSIKDLDRIAEGS